jgi:predicted dienelactone hydrolase
VVKVKAEIAAAKAGGLTFQGVTLDKWADKAVIAAGAKDQAVDTLGATEVTA